MGVGNRHGNLAWATHSGGLSLTDQERVCYNLVHRAWTDARRRGRLWSVLGSVACCPFHPENWFDSVERVEAGETMDSKNGQ
jgi:hypothetical protein